MPKKWILVGRYPAAPFVSCGNLSDGRISINSISTGNLADAKSFDSYESALRFAVDNQLPAMPKMIQSEVA
jgi:hypothetical protein